LPGRVDVVTVTELKPRLRRSGAAGLCHRRGRRTPTR
jgi:hypothetical protein